MKIETRQPASRSGAMKCASRFSSRATSSPPSVVRSSRRSGTRQTACGRWRSAIACISGVAAISRLSGSVSAAISASMSASVMCRRSSRRCAVMPSAPGGLGQPRRAHRLGIGPAAGVPDRRDVVDVHAEPRRPSGAVRVMSGLASGCLAGRAGPCGLRSGSTFCRASRSCARASIRAAAASGRPRPAAASDSSSGPPRPAPAAARRRDTARGCRGRTGPACTTRSRPGRTRLSTPSLIAAKAWAKASDTRPKSWPLAPCPRMRRPSPSATGAMSGKVSGLPTAVPISAAIMLARIARATHQREDEVQPEERRERAEDAAGEAERDPVRRVGQPADAGARDTRCRGASRAAGAAPRGSG